MKKILFLFLFSSSLGFSQIITTFAGNGIAVYAGDGGQATSASFTEPRAIATDKFGNVFIVDEDDNVVRKVNTSGIVTTIVGTGAIGFFGDGGPATSAKMTAPSGIALDTAGNIYIADRFNHVIRFVNIATGIITTVAGQGGFNGFGGDGGPATSAQLNLPENISLDKKGNLYIADGNNNKIRVVNTSGIISTFAGVGTIGYSGDGAAATAAQLSYPICVLADTATGKVYVSDLNNHRIRVIDTFGIIISFAGAGTSGFSGDGAAAISAQLNYPNGIALDTNGTLYIADAANNRIRKVTALGIISTYAGTGIAGFSGDGGPATSAKLFNAPGITVDIGGNLYIAEYYNSRVRKVSYCSSPINVSISGTFSVCLNDSTQLTANGASTYTWCANADTATSTSVYVNPIDTSAYVVVGASGGCIAVDSVSVNVIFNCTSSEKNFESGQIAIYPNPTSGLLFIPLTGVDDERVEIYNSLGEAVFSSLSYRRGTEGEVDISQLNNGIYFVRILRGTEVVQQTKVIKQ